MDMPFSANLGESGVNCLKTVTPTEALTEEVKE